MLRSGLAEWSRRNVSWLVLALAVAPAVWHVFDFEGEADPEYPMVVRPTFSPFPPAAYRLAEPGDTIDRVSLYLASIALVLCLAGIRQAGHLGRSIRPWVAALLASGLAFWYTATPGPSPDGWHGLGFRAVMDPGASPTLRLILGASLGLLALSALLLLAPRRGVAVRPSPLLLLATGLVLLRLLDWPRLEPAGYWTRWALLWGMLAFVLALARALPGNVGSGRSRAAGLAVGVAVSIGLIWGGLSVLEFHRPIPRLKAAVPGRIYISAMPDRRGLELAHRRHRFKTIINLFPEDTPQRSPLWPQEVAFVREYGIRYLRSPAAPEAADAFLDRTLAAAQDPAAWPILVHCHGCMDRTPAWLGIYRFVVQNQPLDAILREIEAHRGYRPKASVTLLYNHVLPRLAPARFAADPTSRKLIASARSAPDPYAREPRSAGACPDGEVRTARSPHRSPLQ